MNRRLLAAALVLGMARVCPGVGPAAWNQATEADFSAGTAEKVVVSSLGEVTLARAMETLLSPQEDLGMVSALAVDGQDRLYLAAAPGGTVYRLEGGKLVKFASLPGAMVRCLVFVKDDLIAGVSGKGEPAKGDKSASKPLAGLYRIDPKGNIAPIWTDPAVTFVWAVVPGPQGSFSVGTGPEGKVYQVAPDGKATVLYDSDDNNILALVGGRGGLLFAGTGENGLVIEIDPLKRKGRILYDAPEKEISSLVMDADGILYAGTSDATKAAAAGLPSEAERPRPPVPTVPSARPPPAGEGVLPAPAGSTGPAGAKASPAEGAGGSAGATVPATQPAPAPAQVIRVVPPRAPAGAPPTAAPPTGEVEAAGNAVYRLDNEGFVRAVFRRPVTVLAMSLHAGALTLGTGHGGQVFALNVGEDRSSVLAKLDPKDVTAMVADSKGRLILGTADKAALYAMDKGFASKGTLVSKALDAGQVARWGTMNLRADVPAGCSMSIATRSGNVTEPKDNTWSEWSAETPVSGVRAGPAGWSEIACPAGRFLQYRLTLAGNGQVTPAVQQVRLIYQVANLAPLVRSVQVVSSPRPQAQPGKPDEADQPLRYRIIQIRADDPNGDAMHYAVFFRRAGQQQWVKLADKLTEPSYVWDTLGTEDGTYELRVEAGDAPANPPASALKAERITRGVLLDNTAPQVTNLAVKPGAKGQVSLSGSAADATSRIRQLAYAVDSNEEWTVLLPSDGICDAQKETFATTLKDLKGGAHRIALRAIDEFNNAGYASVEVTVAQ